MKSKMIFVETLGYLYHQKILPQYYIEDAAIFSQLCEYALSKPFIMTSVSAKAMSQKPFKIAMFYKRHKKLCTAITPYQGLNASSCFNRRTAIVHYTSILVHSFNFSLKVSLTILTSAFCSMYCKSFLCQFNVFAFSISQNKCNTIVVFIIFLTLSDPKLLGSSKTGLCYFCKLL